MTKRASLLLSVSLLAALAAMGQKPEIGSINRNSAAPGELVIINGNSFGTDEAAIKVHFGAAVAETKTVGNQLIEVFVPGNATYDNITVTNTTEKLSAYSAERFFLNIGGEHGLTVDDFTPQADFDSESGLYDLCLCDLDEDGKTEIIAVNEKSNSISVFQNGSAVGTMTFPRTNFLLNAKSLHVTCGDLNGDGKQDLVVSQGEDGDRIFLLKNNGGLAFTAQSIKLTGRKVKRVAIADLDLNGKPEIIVTDKGSNIISVLNNLSDASTLSFASPINITVTGAATTDALEIFDLNADGLPELVTSTFLSNVSDVYILVNRSTSGSFNFDEVLSLPSSKNIVNITIGDLDGDHKPDLAATRLQGDDLHIFMNSSDEGGISFDSPVSISTSAKPWGLAMGDLDGDGKLDMVVTSIEAKTLTILNNESTSGSLAFAAPVSLATTFITRNIDIGDMDGDAKPDIVFTSVDNNQSTPPVVSSKVSIIRNKLCMVPKLAPNVPLTICDGVEFHLSATEAAGTTYEWRKDGAVITSGFEDEFTVTTSGEFTVTAISEEGACSKISNTVTVTVAAPGAGLNGTDPDAGSNGPVCAGNTLQLNMNDVGASAYRWTGPNGFSAEVREPVIENFEIENTGLYVVQMFTGGCVALTDSVIVEGINVPEFFVSFSGAEEFCEGSTKVLTISPAVSSGFSYQWVEETAGDLSGQSGSTFNAVQSGTYSVRVSSSHPGCSATETETVTIVAVGTPLAAFITPALVCLSNSTDITNNSTIDNRAEVVYAWTFDADDTSSEHEPSHFFTDPGIHSIALTVSYDGVQGCSSTIEQEVEVVSITTPAIIAEVNSICPGDTVALSIEGDYSSIAWSTGSTNNSIEVKEAGEYKVNTIDINGCESADSLDITLLDAPVITVTTDKEILALGEHAVLTASGASSYEWSPSEGLNDSTSNSPTAEPTVTTTYVVIGTSNLTGCNAKDSVTIVVTGIRLAVNPPVLFTPNSDGSNDTWIIPGIVSYPDCTMNVFDSRGRRVYEQKGYNNEWDGTNNGSPLPEGVYYFVFSCPDATSTTGSVSIVR